MASFKDLFDPNETYGYFQHADQFPFAARSRRFSVVNAGWLADCSLLVYLRTEDQVKKRLADGYEVKCFGFDRPGAQAFVASDTEKVIVCFRGTEVDEWQDVVADAKIKLVSRDEHHSGKIHRGFYDALGEVWPEIDVELTRIQNASTSPIPVWFTGHSLGAAMATLAADRYDHAHALYTFGSPRVGDHEFRQAVRVNGYRFVNNNDGVTTVPPGLPLSPYRHFGDLKYLDQGGVLIDDPRFWRRFKASLTGHLEAIKDVIGDFRAGDFNTVPFDQLRDHSPTNYATSVWKNIV